MKKVTRTLAVILFTAPAFSSPTLAQTQLAGYNLRGSMGLGPRMVNEDINKEKYQEDFNLFSGFRLFDFSLAGEAAEGEGKPFDYFRMEGSSLGGDPFPSGSFRLGKRGLYDFRVAMRRAEYRYNNRNDTRAFSSVLTGSSPEFIGDPHIFHWNRDFADVDLIIHPEDWPRLTFSYRRQEQIGDSLTTRRLSRAAFSLFEPMDKVTNEYRVALDHRLGPVDVTLEQGVRLWNNDTTTFLVRPSPGMELGSGDTSTLRQFRWHQSETVTNPVTRVRLHALPISRLEVKTGYIYSRTSADNSFVNFLGGTTSRQERVNGEISGSGDGDRNINLFDLGYSFRILDNLFFHNTYRYYSSLGSGKTRPVGADALIELLTLKEEANRITKTDTDIKGNTVRAFFEYLPWQNLTLRLGYLWQDRRARNIRNDIRVRDIVTRDSNVIAGFHFRPFAFLSVLGEYENLSVDHPFTEISASDEQRAKVRIQLQPFKTLGMNVDYRIKTRKNTGGTPDFGVFLSEPQRLINQGASDMDEKDYSVSLWCRPLKGLTLNASYMRQDLDSNTEIESFFDRVPLGETANFSEDNDIFQGGLLYEITSNLSTSFRYSFVNAKGIFPLSSSDYSLGALYTFKLLGAKMGLDFNFRHVSLDERGDDVVERLFPARQTSDFRVDNDYKTDLWTVLLRVELE